MGSNNLVFLENIEWFDESGQQMLARIPEQGSGEIKFGAQLTVRESQAGVLFYKGKACDAFGSGRHTLKTGNIPILTKILSVPWGMSSPLRAEVYLVNLKIFTNLKWGTSDPVAFRDAELGLVRLRAHGVYNLRIVQPILFINAMAGTMGRYTTDQVEEYLRQVIVSRFNDHLGEKLRSLFDLPGRFDELAAGLQERLRQDFSRLGLALDQLYISSITPPTEVQEAIDDQGRLRVIKDLDSYVRLKAASAMEKAATAGGEATAGLGLGLGMMLPAMFAARPAAVGGTSGQPGEITCAECRNIIPDSARFCPYCGHQQLILNQCAHCGKNITPGTAFCPRCGHPVGERPAGLICPHCHSENLPGAVFCNACGEKNRLTAPQRRNPGKDSVVDLHVSQPCPQCHGPVDLRETDRVLACPYCGVRSLLVSQGPDRFLLPSSVSPSQHNELVYAPYLRFKGSIFVVSGQAIRSAILDTTLTGSRIAGLPHSLGLRPQAMRLQRLGRESPGRFLPLTLKAKDILDKAIQLSSLDADRLFRETAGDPAAPPATRSRLEQVHHRAMIGKVVSILYLPLVQHGPLLLDGILQRPLTEAGANETLLSQAGPARGNWHHHVLPMLCPRCGGSLDGEDDCAVLHCTGCDTLWSHSATGLSAVDSLVVAGDGGTSRYLGFWRISVAISGLDIGSFADFLERTNQPLLPKAAWRGQPFHFWIPACKLRPNTFLLACRQTTLNQHKLEAKPGPLPKTLLPVSLPASEARQALKLTLAACAVSRRNIWPHLPTTRFGAAKASLVYLPCVEQGQELLQPHTGLAIAKNVLQLGRTL